MLRKTLSKTQRNEVSYKSSSIEVDLIKSLKNMAPIDINIKLNSESGFYQLIILLNSDEKQQKITVDLNLDNQEHIKGIFFDVTLVKGFTDRSFLDKCFGCSNQKTTFNLNFSDINFPKPYDGKKTIPFSAIRVDLIGVSCTHGYLPVSNSFDNRSSSLMKYFVNNDTPLVTSSDPEIFKKIVNDQFTSHFQEPGLVDESNL